MMRLNFPDRHKRARYRSALLAITAVLGIVAAGVLLIRFAPESASAPLYRIVRPLWNLKISTNEMLAVAASTLRSKTALEEENRRIRQDSVPLRIVILEREMLKDENARLRELLGRRTFDKTILGRVLVRPNTSPYDTLVLDVGKRQGVREGNYVLADGVIIGSTARVQERTSVVELLSSPGNTIDVVIGASSTPATAEGRGGGMFRVRLPRDVPVREGDNVVLPILSARVFAVVEDIVVETSDPFQTILFRNPVSLAKLIWVEVLTERFDPLPSASST